MPKCILDPGVEDELWGVWQSIAQDNPAAATRVIEAVGEAFKALAANAGLGRMRRFRNPRHLGIRSWRVPGFEDYLIFYRGTADGIQVQRVYHGARGIEALFGEK